MKKVFATLTLVGVFFLANLDAAGTVRGGLNNRKGDGGSRYLYTWVSDASGNVSGDTTTITFVSGSVVQLEFTPDGGGTQPTDLYDVTLLDARGVDILVGAGANLSNASSKLIKSFDFRVLSDETFQLVIANAGNAKGGTLRVWVETTR